MTDLVAELKAVAEDKAPRTLPFGKVKPEELLEGRAANEIEKLTELLRHADKFVIWEETQVRDGFQEEIEAAVGL